MYAISPEYESYTDINKEILEVFYATKLFLSPASETFEQETHSKVLDAWSTLLTAPFMRDVPKTYIQSQIRYHIIQVYLKEQDPNTSETLITNIRHHLINISALQQILPLDPLFWQRPNPDSRYQDPYQQTIIRNAFFIPATDTLMISIRNDLVRN